MIPTNFRQGVSYEPPAKEEEEDPELERLRKAWGEDVDAYEAEQERADLADLKEAFTEEERVPPIPQAHHMITRDGALIGIDKDGNEIFSLDPQGYDGYQVKIPSANVDTYMNNDLARKIISNHGVDIGMPEPVEDDDLPVQRIHRPDKEENEPAPEPVQPTHERGERRPKTERVCRFCGKPLKHRGYYCNDSHKQKWHRRKKEEEMARSGGPRIQTGGVNINFKGQLPEVQTGGVNVGDPTNMQVGGGLYGGDKIGGGDEGATYLPEENRHPKIKKVKVKKPKPPKLDDNDSAPGIHYHIHGDVVGRFKEKDGD